MTKKLTATDVVIQCENNLGFTHPDHLPLWRSRQIEAGKINQKLRRETRVSLEDLMLAVEYCRRKREPVLAPVGLFFRVEEARAQAQDTVVLTDLGALVQQAMSWEMRQTEPDSYWLGRLVRCHGDVREEVVHEWREAGRGA